MPWYKASRQVSAAAFPECRTTWDRAALAVHYARWAELAAGGIGVHCGEGGYFMHTPHDVFLRWFRDVLEILAGHNIGFSLWEFGGTARALRGKPL